MTYEDETVEGCHLPGQANRFAPGAPGEAPWRVAVLGPRLVIAGPASGVGKTTVATGILAALARRGDRPAGAKVGPDFIDPGYHAVACGRPPRNLDAWLCGADAVRPLAARAAADAGMLVVEGVMGLFDGAADGEVSSTADVSRLLDAPVVLVVDASAMSGSVAALVHGYSTFDPELRVGGVILNRVGSDGHEALLREALDGLAVPVLGALRRDDALTWRDRHLGLVPVAEQPGEVRGALDRLAAAVAAGVDLEAVVALARSAPAHRTGPVLLPPPGPPVSVGVAGGPAFTFTYTDTIEALEAAGARVVAFDPLADGRLPGGLDGLVIGGGFPEVHAAGLADNRPLLDELAQAVAADLPTWAECGGLLLLAEELDGQRMAGAIPARARMTDRLTLGYRTVTTAAETPLGPAGTVLRGHEFHYSTVEPGGEALDLASRWGARREGWGGPDLLATYVHHHPGGDPTCVAAFAARCALRRALRGPGRE
ncbi:MAG TPA: cobyrinate a,c-diamide synthase [Acidimicrobiales bacterium]|nr:cobyrinate a,c-diamide synthase [Acidimicrobiales bacterium]